MTRKQLAIGCAAAILLSELLLTSFRRGWNQMTTDFPNYYTAAVLTLQKAPLRSFYDWTWFQRQINYAGIDGQLGAYTPHTPLTIAPLLPLAHLKPLAAKRAWLALELILLAASVWVLSKATALHAAEVLLLALLAHSALSANLLLGQYYLLILFLLALAACCLIRRYSFAAGVLTGVIFALKLYTAPLVFYFAVRRQWRAFWGMIASCAILTLVAAGMFGWNDVWYFASTVMKRGIEGEVINPYHPLLGSMTAFLRRAFLPEAELNPHPLVNAPALFFFLRPFYALSVLLLTLLGVRRLEERDEPRAFAWFVIALFVLSSDAASYHLILLVVPAALLLRNAESRWAAGFVALFVAAEAPVYSWDAWLFPRAWLFLALWIYAGWPYLRQLRIRQAAAAVLYVAVACIIYAALRFHTYSAEPPQLMAHALITPGSLFASAPAVNRQDFVYQALGSDRYVLASPAIARIKTFAFDGEAFHPAMAARGGAIYFELVSHGHSRICAFDAQTNQLQPLVGAEMDPREPAVSADGTKMAFISRGDLYLRDGGNYTKVLSSGTASAPAFFPDGERVAFAEGRPGSRAIRIISLRGGEPLTITHGTDSFEPAVSPDGARLAYVESRSGSTQIRIRQLAAGTDREITSGACNNNSPAWLDSDRLIFASDCSRGMGLPALYTVRLGSR